jgi:signal transduction histidine kinase
VLFRSMSSLVNDLLMLARMDAGQTVMEKAPLDLSDVAVETMERLIPLATRNGVMLEAGELPEVHILGDRQYMIQMISNLVENGIKYTTGNDKRVHIETGTTNGAAWVRVSDTGPGIAPEHLPHLFDRFYRIDKSRNRTTEEDGDLKAPNGSGLGLSIVRWIAHTHGGEILVESTMGVGTTFEARFKTI